MTTAENIYDNHPPNWIGLSNKPRDLDQVKATVFVNCGDNTPAERLACAAVLYRNGARDLLPMLGLTHPETR